VSKRPVLSIVTPTGYGFSEDYLQQIPKIQGDVEFVLVYPPGCPKNSIDDPNVRKVTSPLRGELIQRLTGLLNSSGEYVLSMNDDQFVHPEIVSLIERYFRKFPESWVLALNKENMEYDISNKKRIPKEWPNLQEIDKLTETPIAPLNKVKFDARYVFWPFAKRKDQCGGHIENFDQKIWKNSIVQKALEDVAKIFNILGPLKWIPFWCLDRLLSLSIQAKFFKKDLVIGHRLQQKGMIKTIDHSRGKRFYVAVDILLVKRFPRYGYFWNLTFFGLWGIPKRAVRYMFKKLFKNQTYG